MFKYCDKLFYINNQGGGSVEEVKMRHPVCIVPPHIYDEVRDNKTEFAKAFNGFMEGRL